jgi:solute carrier family 8 (sodium/calcium exchanger)
VTVWNATVANLTLMALGSSAPEILLSVIEICFNNFEAGDLGPGTIVGSAAFNLLIITAVCVYYVPKGQTRRIEVYRVSPLVVE